LMFESLIQHTSTQSAFQAHRYAQHEANWFYGVRSETKRTSCHAVRMYAPNRRVQRTDVFLLRETRNDAILNTALIRPAEDVEPPSVAPVGVP